MTDIKVGAAIKAVDRPAAVTARDETFIGNLSTADPTPGSPVVDLTFTAPTSGRVLLILSAAVREDSSNDVVTVFAEIYEGVDTSGTLVVAATGRQHGWRSIDSADGYFLASRASVVKGLTPGATHYARVILHAFLGGGTADVAMREISIIPTT